MSVEDTLQMLKHEARRSPELRDALLAAAEEKNALTAFCRTATAAGFPLYEMDLLSAGEERYAAMRRSTNGGGENSPLLQFEDDTFELFLAELRALQTEMRLRRRFSAMPAGPGIADAGAGSARSPARCLPSLSPTGFQSFANSASRAEADGNGTAAGLRTSAICLQR